MSSKTSVETVLATRMQELGGALTPTSARLRELGAALRPAHDRLQALQDAYTPMHDRLQALQDAYTPMHDRLQAFQDAYTPMHDPFRELGAAMTPPSLRMMLGFQKSLERFGPSLDAIGLHGQFAKSESPFGDLSKTLDAQHQFAEIALGGESWRTMTKVAHSIGAADAVAHQLSRMGCRPSRRLVIRRLVAVDLRARWSA